MTFKGHFKTYFNITDAFFGLNKNNIKHGKQINDTTITMYISPIISRI